MGGFTYISKDNPPLKFDIPDTDWKFSRQAIDSIVFQSTREHLTRINFIHHSNFHRAPYYRQGLSNEDVLENYYLSEANYYLSLAPTLKPSVVARNINGPIIPNILWSLEGFTVPNLKFLSIAMIKDEDLISITTIFLDTNNQGVDYLLGIFRSIKPLTDEQVDLIIENETNLGKRKGSVRSPSLELYALSS